MGFLNVVKGIIFRNEIAADVSADNGFEKLVEWLGLDSSKPKAIAETTYFTCLKVLSETMGISIHAPAKERPCRPRRCPS